MLNKPQASPPASTFSATDIDTIAEFNAIVADGDFATLAGTEELENKTLAAPYIVDVNSKLHVVNRTSGQLVLSNSLNNGWVFTNRGASGEVEFVLPANSDGTNFTFIVQNANGIKVTATAGTTIQVLNDESSANGSVTCTNTNRALHLICENNKWIATYASGTWTPA